MVFQNARIHAKTKTVVQTLNAYQLIILDIALVEMDMKGIQMISLLDVRQNQFLVPPQQTAHQIRIAMEILVDVR